MSRGFQGVSVKEFVIHSMFWMIYIISEYFANLVHLNPGENLRFFQSTLLSLPALVLSTYFLALYVIPRYLSHKKWPLFIFWIVLVGIFLFFARIKWAEVINYLESDRYFKMPAHKMLKNIIRDYSITALAVCFYIIVDYRKNQKINEQLIKANAEAELTLLKGQLHPHFLFNSLNNIYSLALTKSDLTADSILKLTELLDYLVYRANLDAVPLSKEIELLQNYIDLERLRYGSKLSIETEMTIENNSVLIAPMIVLPFAENCFKHGGVGEDGIFRISIHLEANSSQFYLQITNSKGKLKNQRKIEGGTGLNNIKKRLQLLYPNQHHLSINDQSAEYTVKLMINFEDHGQI